MGRDIYGGVADRSVGLGERIVEIVVSLDYHIEFARVKWFQKEVKDPQREGVVDVALIACMKHNFRMFWQSGFFIPRQTVAFRKFHVEEYQVGLMFGDGLFSGLQGFGRVAEFDVVAFCYFFCKQSDAWDVVVNDDGIDLFRSHIERSLWFEVVGQSDGGCASVDAIEFGFCVYVEVCLLTVMLVDQADGLQKHS